MESKVSLLRSFGLYSDHFNVVPHLLSNIKELELPDSVLMEIKTHLIDVEDYSLAYIHIYILMHYLSHR